VLKQILHSFILQYMPKCKAQRKTLKKRWSILQRSFFL